MDNLTEILRPKRWEDLQGLNYSKIGSKTQKEILIELAKTGRVRNLMFIGKPGTGKTSTALLFASTYLGTDDPLRNPDILIKNASGERGIDVVRGEIHEFAVLPSNSGKCRIIILDEADGLTYQAQEALKAITENSSINCIFIFCLNNEYRIDDALLSRSAIFRFDPILYSECSKWIREKAKLVDITLADGIAEQVVTYYKGDLRRVVNDFLNVYEGQKILKWEPKRSVAAEIFNDKSPQERYLELASKQFIDPAELIEELFELSGFKNPKIFGDAILMLRGDPLIGVMYALTGLV